MMAQRHLLLLSTAMPLDQSSGMIRRYPARQNLSLAAPSLKLQRKARTLPNGEIISSPVYGDGMVFLQLWRESKIHAIRLAGNGKSPETVWVSKKPGPVESSVLYYRGLLYALMDNGVLVCLDGKTGDELYRERLGAACNSSPVASDGRIFLSDNDGKTFVVKAGREFKLLETNLLGERISASPAITGKWLDLPDRLAFILHRRKRIEPE